MASTAEEILHEMLMAEFEQQYSDEYLFGEFVEEHSFVEKPYLMEHINIDDEFEDYKQMRFQEYKEMRLG